MKKIECIIRSERLKDLIAEFKKINISGLTVSEVRGFGAQNERPDSFLFVHKTKLEIYATEVQVKEIISIILMQCSTGKIGDGKIAIIPIEDCIRVRTGSCKDVAILPEKEGN